MYEVLKVKKNIRRNSLSLRTKMKKEIKERLKEKVFKNNSFRTKRKFNNIILKTQEI